MPTSAMRLTGVTNGASSNPTTEQQEQLPCPRCDSTNTKFCYYNNYNFSQPRHFCKSCRRYWTHGGTLRDIPIGGGSRKGAKRSRTCSSSSSASVSSVNSVVSNGIRSVPLQATPILFPPSSNGVTLNSDVKGSALSLCGSFTSLLNHNTAAIGLGSGFDDINFGLGRAMWPFSTVCESTTTNVESNSNHHTVPIPATWQFEGLESSNAGEYFAWPDLSITTPGNSLK